MSTPTLKELINELNSVLRWHTLGVNLGLKTQQLGTIERNYRGDDERCRTEMLACWIDNTTHPTWKSVAEALYLMKEYSVADKIQRKYIISTTTKEGMVWFYCISVYICYGCTHMRGSKSCAFRCTFR